MRLAWHVACIREMRNSYKVVVRKPECRDCLEDLCTDERIILECISGKECGKMWTGFICFRTGISGRLL